MSVAVIGVALLGFAACDSKVETARESAELEKKAVIAHKDAKIFAENRARQAALDTEAAKVRAEEERKNAENIRNSAEKSSNAPEGKVSEPGGPN